MIELSEENRLNDHLWVDIEGYDEEGRHQTGCRHATPAEVAAAHPKCGTCRFYGRNSSLRVKPCNACMNPRSPYFVVADDIINPALDYCRHHSELNKETT